MVFDSNGNGVVDDGSELFGGRRFGEGFRELARWDTNQDGQVSAADENFEQLKIWVDANADGSTDLGELKSLADLGVESIQVSKTMHPVVQNGNILLEHSTAVVNGNVHAVIDVYFEVATLTPESQVSHDLALEAEEAPADFNFMGYVPAIGQDVGYEVHIQ